MARQSGNLWFLKGNMKALKCIVAQARVSCEIRQNLGEIL